MEILGYIIPEDLQKSPFIISLHYSYKRNNKLTNRQTSALLDVIGVSIDFYDYEYEPPKNSDYENDFYTLRNKLKKNNFRSVKSINNCVRALNSIISNKLNTYLIDISLGRIKFWR